MDRLSQHLRDNDLSQRVFAEMIGCSASYLSEIISGRKQPGLGLAVAIERETFGAVPVEVWVGAA